MLAATADGVGQRGTIRGGAVPPPVAAPTAAEPGQVGHTVSALPGGVIALVPSSSWLGVCVFDEFSHCVRCCKVAWAHRSFAFDTEDTAASLGADAADCSNEELVDDDCGGTTTSRDTVAGGGDRFFATGGVVTWLVQLIASMEPSKLSVCHPSSSSHFPDALAELLREHVLRRGGTVRCFQHRDHNLERAMAQLQSLWPSTTVASWCGRLKLLVNGVSSSGAAVDAELVAALSCTLDLVIRTGQRIADVVEQPPLSLVLIDAATLHALSIFRQDTHPCAYQGIGGSKEGVSLYATFLARTQTPMGRALLRQWMLCPVNDEAELLRRQSVVAFFSTPGVYPVVAQMAATLQHLKHPGRIMHRIRSARHNVRDYVELLRCASGLTALHGLLQQAMAAAAAEQQQQQQQHQPLNGATAVVVPPMLYRLLANIDVAALASLTECIRSTVSLTTACGGGSRGDASGGVGAPILPGVDGELDELRAHYGQLGTYLTHVAEELALSLPPLFASWKLSCIFYPRVGFLVAVNLDTEQQKHLMGSSSAPQIFSSGPPPHLLPSTVSSLPHEWELVFQTPDCIYCRTPATRDLDESIGDIHTAMVLRESTVQVMVDEAILARAPCVLSLLHAAELDCLLAFAMVSVEGGWCRPTLCRDCGDDDAERRVDNSSGGCTTPLRLRLDGAFHPLLARINNNNQVVPLRLHTTASTGRVCIFTGPNGSGKSMAMQTVALVVYLAHIGCFVPCHDGACVALVDRIVFVCDGTTAGGGGGATGPVAHASPRGGMTASSVAEVCGGSSSFAGELLAVSRALTQSTSRSLVLLDEFGRGTLAVDGVALLASFLLALMGAPTPPQPTEASSAAPSRGHGCPTVLLATHYTEIFHVDVGLMTFPLVQHLQMMMTAVPSLDDDDAYFRCGVGRGPFLDCPPSPTTAASPSASGFNDGGGVVFSYTFVSTFGGDATSSSGSAENPSEQLLLRAQQQRMQRQFGSCALQCARVCGVPAFFVERIEALHRADGRQYDAVALPQARQQHHKSEVHVEALGNDDGGTEATPSTALCDAAAMTTEGLLAALMEALDPAVVLPTVPTDDDEASEGGCGGGGWKQLAARWAVVDDVFASWLAASV